MSAWLSSQVIQLLLDRSDKTASTPHFRYGDETLYWRELPFVQWHGEELAYIHALTYHQTVRKWFLELKEMCRQREIPLIRAGKARVSLWTLAAAGKLLLDSPHKDDEGG